jgi:YD repeat-containing protein
LGAKWNGEFERYVQLTGNASQSIAFAYRPDGKVYGFTLSTDGTGNPDADISSRLTALKNASGTIIGWQYLNAENDSIEPYNSAGKLLSIIGRDGRTLTFTQNASGVISTITDFVGQQTSFAYDVQQRITSVTLPDGNRVSYSYDSNNNLVAVTFPDSSVKNYHYEDSRFPNALTGITDERGTRYATWSYDTNGRAISSEHAGVVDRHTLTYGTNSTVVTDPLGTARTYNFSTILGVVKNTGVSQPGGSGCGPAAESLTYDANGNISSRADFNGRKTTYAYDLTRNLETSRTEGLSSAGVALPETRTITTAWHPTWRLPVQVNEYAGASASGNPLRRTSTAYDDKGNVVSRSVADVAVGATRTWTTSYTYSVAVPGLILQKIEDGPRTDVTDTTVTDYYPHDEVCAGAALGTGRDKGCRGQVKRVTNPLGQITQFTRYNAHGQLEEIVDPNGVLTTLTYDLRQRLTSRSTAGETTGFQYDGVGSLTRLTQPDGSYIAYTYDGARRLTEVADNLGNRIAYTLDAAGNRTREEIRDPQGALARTLTRAYDALGRMQTLTGVGND